MSKLSIPGDPQFGAIHVGSPYHIALPDYNPLNLVNNCKTDFHSFSYNYNSRASWKKKVLSPQLYFRMI